MRDIDEDWEIHGDSLAWTEDPGSDLAQRVNAGDLVFRSRGTKFGAGLVESLPGDTVLAAPMVLIRPRRDRVRPAYLRWFINEMVPGEWYAEHAAGTRVQMISVASLRALPVGLPPLETQDRIIALNALIRKERQLVESIRQLRAATVSGLLRSLIHEPHATR